MFQCRGLLSFLRVLPVCFFIPVLAAAQAAAAMPLMPLDQIHTGMHGIGKTIFVGDKVEEFQVEILGVVRNMGPRQAVILAKLSGGPLADTGVIEGMSGSPVYIDGKLIGAVALGFPFAKSPIAGITPIEQMIAQDHRARTATAAQLAAAPLLESAAAAGGWKIITPPSAPAAHAAAAAGSLPAATGGDPDELQSLSLPDLQTPVVMSGFVPEAVRQFLPQLQAMGLRATLGGASPAAADAPPMGPPSDLHPGDMISVQLMRGDMGVAADGTVTYIDGNQIYAFGHRFLLTGATAMPFSKATVLAVIPGLMSSTKMDNPGVPMGVIHQDLSQGVYGDFGGSAPMIPVRVQVKSARQPAEDYHFEMIDNPGLSPALLNLALGSTLDATTRGLGVETVAVRQTVHLSSGATLTAGDLLSSDQGSPVLAAAAATRPLSLFYSSALAGVHVTGMEFDLTASDDKRVMTLEQLWADRSIVAPGATVILTAIFRTADGAEVERPIPLRLPEALAAGTLTVTVGDGSALGPAGLGGGIGDVAQLTAAINRLPRADEICARITRSDPAYVLDGQRFPSPPPSLARALAASPTVDTDIHSELASTVVESRSAPLPYVISGVKTLRLTVREP